MTRVLVVEDEESFSDALSYMLRKEGFEVAVAATGTARAHRVRPDRRRHRAARPDAAGDVRHRGVPAAAAALARADHHGHRPGQRDRQGGRAGDRRRRLRDQAVLAARAGRPDPGGAAPAAAREAGRVGGADAGGRPGPDGRRAARGHRRRRLRAAAAQGVRAAGAAAAQRRPGAHPRPAHRPGLGRRLRRRHQDPRRARQAAALQDRAGAVQPRATSSPCAAWATSSSPDRRRAGARVAAALRRGRRRPSAGCGATRPVPQPGRAQLGQLRRTRPAPISAVSSGPYDRYIGSAPTCASGEEVHHQCRSCPPSPQPRRSNSASVETRTLRAVRPARPTPGRGGPAAASRRPACTPAGARRRAAPGRAARSRRRRRSRRR